MVPLILKLRNFLSYGAHVQTIDFEPFRLICLSGKNGHGKSALLDAITWVLWGQARKTGSTHKSDEGLLRLGQHHMMVSFDFLCNQKRYRVQREFVVQQNRSSTELNFGIMQDDGTCKSLNEKSLRATQQKIIDVLGLDYESCINSIFLRQGQSNEFSQKSAKERKEVLANILNMQHYETLKNNAQEKAREHAHAAERLQPLIEHIKNIVNQKDTLTNESLIIQTTIECLEKRTAALLVLDGDVRAQEKKGEQELQKKKFLQHSFEELQNKYSDTIKILHNVRYALRELQRTARMLGPLSAQELQRVQNILRTYDKIATQHATLKEKMTMVQLQHAQITQRCTEQYHTMRNAHLTAVLKKEQEHALISQEQKIVLQHISELQKTSQALQKKLADLPQPISFLNNAITVEEKKLERKKQFYLMFGARLNLLIQSAQSLDHKLSLSDAHNPACPLCEQILSSSRKQLLYVKLTHEQKRVLHQKKRLIQLLPNLKQQLLDEHALLTKQKQLLTEATTHQQELVVVYQKKREKDEELAIINKRLQEALAEAVQAHDLTQKIPAQELFFFQQEDFSCSLKQMQEVESALGQLAYNAEEHVQIKQRVSMLEQYEDTDSDYKVGQEKHKNMITMHMSVLRRMKIEMEQLREQLDQYGSLEQEMTKIKTVLAQHEEQRVQLEQEKNTVLQKKGAVDQQLKIIQEKEQELIVHEKNYTEEDSLSDDYQLIAQALGKNGIQALLIETAIPELEFEANALLSKLTDNQSHIMIESTKDLKSGGTRETLDINISDTVGTRPYELFSGGEAFRIDFALRIAISKLLARRSGTSLQTLIIDEGFGSQDEEGLARIMEALYKIQDDFAKIIIVSHLPEMKNQFPTHFFVQKYSSGSQITVFEQG